MLLLSFADFFKIYRFEKFLCQTVWIQIMTDILSVVIWVQTVCKGYQLTTKVCVKGAQCLSGRVLDSRPKGRVFQPQQRHCIVDLEQDTFILA